VRGVIKLNCNIYVCLQKYFLTLKLYKHYLVRMNRFRLILRGTGSLVMFMDTSNTGTYTNTAHESQNSTILQFYILTN